MAAAVIVAVGSNLPSSTGSTPLESCLQAVGQLGRVEGISITAVSRWYESSPVPASEQPSYVNGTVLAWFDGSPLRLLSELHMIEARHERQRTIANAARTLDLDLVDFGGLVQEDVFPVLPHPRAHQRSFVLIPLRDAAPLWKHPTLGRTVSELIEMLDADCGFCRALTPD